MFSHLQFNVNDALFTVFGCIPTNNEAEPKIHEMLASITCLNRTILTTESKYFEPPCYEVMSSVLSFYLYVERSLFLSGKYTNTALQIFAANR